MESLPIELLECILLHLSVKDLLLSQRISKALHGVVHSSKRIRKALFLPVNEVEALRQRTKVKAGRNEHNHWRWVAHNAEPTGPDKENNEKPVYASSLPYCSPLLNPLLVRYAVVGRDLTQGIPRKYGWRCRVNLGWKYEGFMDMAQACDKESSTWSQQSEATDDYKGLRFEAASWREMLMIQPPASQFHVYCESMLDRADESTMYKVGQADGICMGRLFEEARNHLMGCPRCQCRNIVDDYVGCVRWTAAQEIDIVEGPITGFEVLGRLKHAEALFASRMAS